MCEAVAPLAWRSRVVPVCDRFMENTVTEKPVRIVVVDDSRDFRDLVISLVRSHPNWQLVGEASEGQEAIAIIQEANPDVVLLDLGMPGLNGFEVTRAIHKTSANSKIIVVSQESSPDIVDEAFCIGAYGYVLKSDVWILGEAVKAVLDGRQFLSSGLARGRLH